MKPEQAWQAAQGQIQLEMPKAAYDTWVLDAQYFAYEDGTFVISVQNDRVSHIYSSSLRRFPWPSCYPEDIPQGSNRNIFPGMGNGDQAAVCVL